VTTSVLTTKVSLTCFRGVLAILECFEETSTKDQMVELLSCLDLYLSQTYFSHLLPVANAQVVVQFPCIPDIGESLKAIIQEN